MPPGEKKAGEYWRFGPSVLSPAWRRLDCAGGEVPIGARSFDLLVLLVRRAKVR
jgi:DNA-binding winged helix-turn-helix (wHTH) protein